MPQYLPDGVPTPVTFSLRLGEYPGAVALQAHVLDVYVASVTGQKWDAQRGDIVGFTAARLDAFSEAERAALGEVEWLDDLDKYATLAPQRVHTGANGKATAQVTVKRSDDFGRNPWWVDSVRVLACDRSVYRLE
jgi:hypothetical protein